MSMIFQYVFITATNYKFHKCYFVDLFCFLSVPVFLLSFEESM